VEAVQALAGAMNDKAATKGILVTTSWFGKRAGISSPATGAWN